MARSVLDAVRDTCLWLPESEEFISHGAPNFRVRGKTFATFMVNHHGDGRIALWLPAPPGSQDLHVQADPKRFFVPPYVGPRGWLGVNLDKGVSWPRVAQWVREAYEHVAPRALASTLGKTPAIKPPARPPSPADIDPLLSTRGKAVLKLMREACLELPEASEGTQFGSPVWLAGKKTFAMAGNHEGKFRVTFWVGVDQQALLTTDPRYSIPAYFGHKGWISVDVTRRHDRAEIAALALQSYRHFALGRMLKQL
jgi:predicted DNA-binding protein (MmcQ/YjbR family)